MDKKWIDDLSENFHNKISDIFKIWVEIGIPNEKYTSRVQNIQRHVNNLLEDMLKEERRHKQEVIDSITSLTKNINELSASLKIDSNPRLDSHESILAQESFLLDKQNELKSIKKDRLRKWKSLLEVEDKLCSRLYEYKENFDISVPTIQLINDFEAKIKELEKLQEYRKHEFITKRELIVSLCHELYNACPNDAIIENIYNDDDVSAVPLSNDFLNQCDNIINRLSIDLRSNIDECTKLRERYGKLHVMLFPSVDLDSLSNYLSKNCEDYSHKSLIMLKESVCEMENRRRDKQGEFIAKYRNQIREKLRDNFSSHLESSERYREILSSQEQSDALFERLETELANWEAIEPEFSSLRQEMEALEKLSHRLTEINLNLKDPIILKNRGGILLKVEKEKNTLKKELPKIEARIRKVLGAIDDYHTVDTSELRFKDFPLSEYIGRMGEPIDGEKENDKKDRTAASKADLSSSLTNSIKKPLKSSQANIYSAANKPIAKISQFKKPEIQNIPSKMLKKKKALSPIPKAKTNLDHRFSKSFSSLEIKKTDHQLSASNGGC